MKKNILVVGSVALDSVQTIHGRITRGLGGSAVHFSMSASKFAPVRIVGVVGEDFPAPFCRLLRRRNICLEGMQVLPGKTFHWKGRYNEDFKNAVTLATELNVFENFKPRLSAAHSKCGVLFLANIDPDLQWDVLKQMDSPRLVACDTMNYWITLKKNSLKKLLSRVNLFFINEEEARQLTKEYNLLTAARLLAKMGPQVVVIKRGDSGSLLFYGGHRKSCGPHRRRGHFRRRVRGLPCLGPQLAEFQYFETRYGLWHGIVVFQRGKFQHPGDRGPFQIGHKQALRQVCENAFNLLIFSFGKWGVDRGSLGRETGA